MILFYIQTDEHVEKDESISPRCSDRTSSCGSCWPWWNCARSTCRHPPRWLGEWLWWRTIELTAEDLRWLARGFVVLAADHLVLAVFERELQEVGVDLRGVAATLAAAVEAEHQVQRALLADVVVRQGALVLQLLPGEDEPLLVRRDACRAQENATELLDKNIKKCRN